MSRNWNIQLFQRHYLVLCHQDYYVLLHENNLQDSKHIQLKKKKTHIHKKKECCLIFGQSCLPTTIYVQNWSFLVSQTLAFYNFFLWARFTWYWWDETFWKKHCFFFKLPLFPLTYRFVKNRWIGTISIHLCQSGQTFSKIFKNISFKTWI